MVRLPQVREVVVSGFKSLRTVNLTSKMSDCSGRPKVYEEAELEALLDRDSCQSQEEQYGRQYFE